MAHVLSSLPPMGDTQMEFLAPGFRLTQIWLLWSFGE